MSLIIFCGASVTAITEPISQISVIAGQRGGSPFNVQNAIGGSFRSYSKGRTRLVTSAAQGTAVSGAQIDNLREWQKALLFQWKGMPVILRDSNGLRLWGAYLNPAVTYYTLSSPKLCTVSFDFQSITFDETTLSQYGGA